MARGPGYDVLVLGGGTAGCVLAARLSEDPGTSVCLVEAGPDYGARDGGGWPADMLDARIIPLSHSWERLDPDDRSQHRARIIGGCSSHNACVVLEGAPQDYDEWGPGWGYAEVAPYLDRARRALGTRTFAVEELSLRHAAFAEAADADAILHPVNADGPVRLNAAFAYLDPARGRPNLTILADTSPIASSSTATAPPGRLRRPASSRPGWSCWPRVPTGRRACCCGAASGPSAACPWGRT